MEGNTRAASAVSVRGDRHSVIFDHRPLETLSELATGKASGELICASSDVEVHVYFQRGRIAWATDSRHPLAFTKRLLDTARIDIDVFREILESCRREKRPLGETLVTWGVANREEVRAALKHQIDLAMTALLSAGPVQTLFLNRSSQFAAYDASLTFALHEVTGGPTEPEVVTSVSRTTLREREEEDVVAERMDRPGLAARLQASVGAEWIEVLDGRRIVESLPLHSSASRLSTMLIDATIADGAELVALRTAEGTLGGAALGDGRSIWCMAAVETTIGALVAGLASIANEAPPASREIALDPGELWATAASAEIEVLREFASRVPELRAAFVTDAVTSDRTLGVGRPSVSAIAASSLVTARTRAILTSAESQRTHSAAEAMRSPRRMMTQEPEFLLFAEELVVEHLHRVVWIVLDRFSSKGLGWGHASALGRRLVDLWASRHV